MNFSPFHSNVHWFFIFSFMAYFPLVYEDRGK